MAVAVMIALLATSCTKDEENGAPEMPPIESFQMDFSDFTDFPDTTDNLKSQHTYQHFVYSYATVGVWT